MDNRTPTSEIVESLRHYQGCEPTTTIAVTVGKLQLIADRLEELEERVSIMMEGKDE